MKKLIVYDGSCPMCRLYTKGMVEADRSGGLSRISNDQLMQESIVNRLDTQRARHEIPLVDLEGGETLYGIDTWAYAFGHRNERVEKLLAIGWFRTMLNQLYAFISYNRRIIITSAPGRWQLLDLQPEFRAGYRLAFIGIVFGCLTIMGTTAIFPIWFPAVVGLILSQMLITTLYLLITQTGNSYETLLDYIGHLGMSLLIGGSIATVGAMTDWPFLVSIGYALAIGQHYIRSYRLGLSPWLSVCFTVLAFLLLKPF